MRAAALVGGEYFQLFLPRPNGCVQLVRRRHGYDLVIAPCTTRKRMPICSATPARENFSALRSAASHRPGSP